MFEFINLFRKKKQELQQERISLQMDYIRKCNEINQMNRELLEDRLSFQQEIIGALDTQLRMVEKITGKVLWDKIEELNLTIKDSNIGGGVHVTNNDP